MFFLTKLKIKGNKKFVIHVVALAPYKILTGWAHHNDRQNLNFVKAINELGKKSLAFRFETEFDSKASFCSVWKT